jgi:rhamnosyltransferase
VLQDNKLDNDVKLNQWYNEKGIRRKEYYLVVGRFVPENNFETMVREFMISNSSRDLVLITGIQGNKFYQKLLKNTHFIEDKRIKFVGTVYDKELLNRIREGAFGYLHGHEVGGTNPSLLESMGNTDLNMLLDVNFNQEVGGMSSLYWSKDKGSLANLINKTDNMNQEDIIKLGYSAKKRIEDNFSWSYIVETYEKLFHTCLERLVR